MPDNPAIGLKIRTVKLPCVVCGRGTYWRRYGKPLCPWDFPPEAPGLTKLARTGNVVIDLKEGGTLSTKALQLMTPAEMEERVGMAKFPQQLSSQERTLLARVALTYGLDPLTGELSIYQGRPYVSIDGRYRIANETGLLDGVDTRPATQAERATWEIPEGDFFFRAEVHKKGCGHPFVGWGWVRKAETGPPRDASRAGYRPLEIMPQRMAEKRAEAQALRKAFFLPLPSTEIPEGVEEMPPAEDKPEDLFPNEDALKVIDPREALRGEIGALLKGDPHPTAGQVATWWEKRDYGYILVPENFDTTSGVGFYDWVKPEHLVAFKDSLLAWRNSRGDKSG